MRGVILLIVVALIGIGAYVSSHQSAQIVSCDQVLGTCTSQTIPITQSTYGG